jgi:hypothetical protein
MSSAVMNEAPAVSTEYRFCCTKVGKLPLDRTPVSDGVPVEDACHGITSYATSLPGKPCN